MPYKTAKHLLSCWAVNNQAYGENGNYTSQLLFFLLCDIQLIFCSLALYFGCQVEEEKRGQGFLAKLILAYSGLFAEL